MNSQKIKSWTTLCVIMVISIGLNACAALKGFKSSDEIRIQDLSYKLGMLYAKDCPEKACIAYTFCKQFEMAYREDYHVFMDAAVTYLRESKLSDETNGVFKALLEELNIETRKDIFEKKLDYKTFIVIAEYAGDGIIDGITTSICSEFR